MQTINKTMVMVFFCLLVLNSFSEADLIDSTCKKTSFPNLCLTTLRSSGVSVKASVNELVINILKASLSYASDSSNQINDLLKKATGGFQKQCLKICAKNYDVAISGIREAIQEIGRNEISMAQSPINSIDVEARNCDSACKLRISIPFSVRNTMLSHFATIMLEILKG
ncbi:cell wall / vacuolar inhibitor of fructosidase 1-like [Impatiens glandulifera]|uniref:cell wall / vacuolar inhibitor of fructosidase 1-like n=1 Tax=Impatiens glandulifera TaxID=253017 RepID=UPI001FB0BC06|nr:cell wall / vacuolar inhibitor of fructosidase 1-like [Impatiens glandulifera]